MKEVLEYLKESKTFYIATLEGGQPRVRPFGAVCEFEERLYIVTNNKKAVYKQMMENPRVEVSCMNKGTWLRLEADVVLDSRREARVTMLKEHPMLETMYNADDNMMEVLYLENATATINAMGAETKVIKF